MIDIKLKFNMIFIFASNNSYNDLHKNSILCGSALIYWDGI